MARLYLVRHGEAAAGWNADLDPGLSDLGRDQAQAMAEKLEPLGPLPILVSPLRRTRETAAPLAAAWNVEPIVDERVAEIPSPTDDLEQRTAWLRDLMGATWNAGAPELASWCDGIVECLLGCERDTVVVSHFVAINVAVGRATDDDRVMCFTPANASVTVVETESDRLRLVDYGESLASTVVL